VEYPNDLLFKPLEGDISVVPIPNGKTNKRVVVCASVRFGDLILSGARHFDSVMRTQLKVIGSGDSHAGLKLARTLGKKEQGFVDQYGNFINRTDALFIVLKNGQKFDPERNGSETELFSEGLY
jgi:hypothetical protein